METKIVVGKSTTLPYSREELESLAQGLFAQNYIEELTDSELFNMIIKEQYRSSESM